MQNKVLLTPVDELVEIVKQKPNCSLSFIKKKLNLPLEVIEKWLVVLEEYSILNVQYKGFEGYVKVTQNFLDKESEKKIDIEKLKEIFIDKCKVKGIGFSKMKLIWPTFLTQYESEIKALFEDKAKGMDYPPEKVTQAWLKYKKELVKL